MPSQFETSKLPIVPKVHPRHPSVAWLLAGAAGAVQLMPVAVALSLQTVDLSRFAGPIAAAVKKATGRELTIGKGPFIRMSLPLSITVENVALSNTPWGTRKDMLRIRRLELKVQVPPLLLGHIVVRRMTLVEPDLLIETDERGKGNWVLDATPRHEPTGSVAPGGSPLSHLKLGETRITGAALTYHDGCGGWQVGAVLQRLSLVPSWKESGLLNVDGALALGSAMISVSGVVGGSDAFAGNQPFPMRLAFSTNGATAQLEGAIQRFPELAGVNLRFSMEIADGPAFGALLGTPLPKLTPCRLDVQVRDSGPGWALDPLHVIAGRSSLFGTASYVWGCPRSRLTIDLRGGPIDLAELSGTGRRTAPARESSAGPGGKVFPREPLPLDALNALDASVSLRLETLRLPSGTEVRSLEARAALANGQLEVERFSLELGGGRITGSLHVHSGRKPGFTAKVDGNAVELAALLGATGTKADVRGAATDLAVALTGDGPSLHEWMASLGGKVRVVVGPGSVESRTLAFGGDVLTQALAAVNPDRASASRTELRCAVINVPVSGGVAQLDRRIAAETSRFNLVISGSVNLGTEMMDLDLRSRATQGLGLGLANLASLARVRGPLANPALTLDPKDMLETASSLHSAVKTRGRSVIQERIRERFFAESPCKTALRETEEKRRSLLNFFRRW